MVAAIYLSVISMPGRSAEKQRPHQQDGGQQPKLIAAWSFDKIENSVAADESGNGYDAVIHSGAALIERPGGGQALAFDGTGDNQAWQGGPQVNGVSIEKRLHREFREISVEAWIRKQPGPWMSIVYRDLWDDPSGFGLVAEWQFGKVFFGHYDPYYKSYVMSETIVQDGEWHHVVGTMQPKGKRGYLYRIYVDGELDAEQLGQWGIEAAPPQGGILKIAYPNISGSDNPYEGALDDIAIYDKALSGGQVKALYQASKERHHHKDN